MFAHNFVSEKNKQWLDIPALTALVPRAALQWACANESTLVLGGDHFATFDYISVNNILMYSNLMHESVIAQLFLTCYKKVVM